MGIELTTVNSMTTPKSPEQIMEGFKDLIHLYENYQLVNDKEPKLPDEAWLRSSMASLLLWAAEQMNEHIAVDPIPELEGADARDLQVGDEVLADCSDFLIEEARKITGV